MNEKNIINIAFAPGMFGKSPYDTPLDTALREIAVVAAAGISWEQAMYAYKYGVTIENNSFMMHPFCWCESESCAWCTGCICPDENWQVVPGKVHREKILSTCDFCLGKGLFVEWGDSEERLQLGAPNFYHKNSGLRVWWYKYISRGVKCNMSLNEESLLKIKQDCINSLSL